MKQLLDAIIEKYQLKSIEDVLAVIPKHMCHITQESTVFETYNPMIIQLSYPESEWKHYEERYRHYAEEVIPSISLDTYLKNFIEENPRLPCFCSEIGDVAGSLMARVLNHPVYVIRRTFVSYLTQPTRRHCLNAIVENNRIRYIDAAIYNQIINPVSRRFMHPSKMDDFNPADIKETHLKCEHWLHTEPYQREIYLENTEIKDTFYPNPDPDGLVDEYLRVFNFSS